jgi:uncharacterized protein (TIGR02266 family)
VDVSHRNEQLEKAKESIGRALELLRGGSALPSAAATLAELTAAAQALTVAEVEDEDAFDSSDVLYVTDRLRSALAKMQDVCAGAPGFEPATSWIARAVAVLYPLCTALDAEPPRSSEERISVVRRAPAGESEQPLPASVGRMSARRRPGNDRRGQARREIHVELGIQSDTNFYTGFACDISSGGLFIATYDLPEVGAEVSVNFRLPGGPLMSLHGIVRWVRELDHEDLDVVPGMGIAFERLEDGEISAINAYIATHAPLFHEG